MQNTAESPGQQQGNMLTGKTTRVECKRRCISAEIEGIRAAVDRICVIACRIQSCNGLTLVIEYLCMLIDGNTAKPAIGIAEKSGSIVTW